MRAAIQTTILPSTSNKPARVKAKQEDFEVTVPCLDGPEIRGNHEHGARHLMKMLGLEAKGLVGAPLDDSYVWIITE